MNVTSLIEQSTHLAGWRDLPSGPDMTVIPPSDEPRLPEPPARLHFVGIGGIGVSGLARLLWKRGYRISGSDLVSSEVTEGLERDGISVAIGHDSANVDGVDFVVATAAAASENIELQAAHARGIPVVKRAAVLGLIARPYRTLAVAGTHGKSTTSGMAAVALDAAGLQPGFAVGAAVPPFDTNAQGGSGDIFVVEADEYDLSFLSLEPDVAIITNIEFDHPDIFPEFRDVITAFRRFIGKIRAGGTLAISTDSEVCRDLSREVIRAGDIAVVTFGSHSGDWTLAGEVGVRGPDGKLLDLALAVPGRHNRLNALAVLASAPALGVQPEAVLPGLAAFTGVGRRFEVIRDDDNAAVVMDYAHHPTEIDVTIAAARERFRNRRIIAVFQPHTYSRTNALLQDFASALDLADSTVLAGIYPSREVDDLGISSETIARLMRHRPTVVETPEDAVVQVIDRHTPGDVVLVLGAGDINRAAARIAQGIA